MSSSSQKRDISIVVPLLNEEGSLVELHSLITESLTKLGRSYEIIFVDDGSTDRSFGIIQSLYEQDRNVEVVRLRTNFGKAAGLRAGIANARGEIIVTMDADLQDLPQEIPRFVEAIDQGLDIVSGWKKVRNDPLGKTLPSKVFNWVTRRVSGIPLHDFNCGFKAYRREVFDHVKLYGELHRYIPVLAGWKGFRVGEIAVEHQARKHGVSKYGVERLAKGFLDLITIYFTRKYASSPLHIFGALGLASATIGLATLVYLTFLWMIGEPIGNRPLLLFGVLTILFGGQLLSFGILAEILAKSEHRLEEPFVISTRLTHRTNSDGTQ